MSDIIADVESTTSTSIIVLMQCDVCNKLVINRSRGQSYHLMTLLYMQSKV
jgi:hypothetical protein